MGGLVRAAGPGPAQPGTGIGRTMLLRSALPYMYLHAAQEFVVRAGRALAKVAPAVGPGALDVLARAERAPNVEERRVLHIRLSREIVQEALQAKCASLFLRESSVVTQVENLTADVPFGVMLASDADGIHAHKCPNPYSCSLPRHQAMRPATASSSTAPKAGGCPLLLSAPPGGARGATGGAMCASGFYPASPGCTRCRAAHVGYRKQCHGQAWWGDSVSVLLLRAGKALLQLPVPAPRAQRGRGGLTLHAQRRHGALGAAGRRRVVTHPWLQEQSHGWHCSPVDPVLPRAGGPLGEGQVLLGR